MCSVVSFPCSGLGTCGLAWRPLTAACQSTCEALLHFHSAARAFLCCSGALPASLLLQTLGSSVSPPPLFVMAPLRWGAVSRESERDPGHSHFPAAAHSGPQVDSGFLILLRPKRFTLEQPHCHECPYHYYNKLDFPALALICSHLSPQPHIPASGTFISKWGMWSVDSCTCPAGPAEHRTS